jgi:hypothetical protein
MICIRAFVHTGTEENTGIEKCRITFRLDTAASTAEFSTIWEPARVAHIAWLDFSKGARDIALILGEELGGSLVRNSHAYTFSAGGDALRIYVSHELMGQIIPDILTKLSIMANKESIEAAPADANGGTAT